MEKPPPPKRPRLSMACNTCRQRKVKCDADYPKCRNCRVRNQTCTTTDPQRPGCPGVREWLDAPEKHALLDTGTRGDPDVSFASQEDGTSPAHHASQNHTHRLPNPPETNAPIAESEISPVHQPFDTSFNIEHGTNRIKVMGGSSSQCLAKSLDVYFKKARMKPISGLFLHGMRHAEELEIPLKLVLPNFPESKLRDRYAAAFIARIQPLYPVVQIHNLQPGMEQLATLESFAGLSREQIPILVMTYLILSLGADEIAQCPTEDGDRYLHAAAGLLSHVIVIPYLPAVQTLLLFTIVYRSRNQEGLAWQTLGMATRIAYTLGLHRPSKRPLERRNADEQELHARVWATCCCLETMMHLESGRPTTIQDEHLARPESIDIGYRFTRWHLGLAEYQGNISHHIYNHLSGTRSVREILLDTARLDRALLAWANHIPPELRPGNDIFCAKNEFHLVAFLSIQYHGAMIALHRAALIAPTNTFEAEVMKHCAGDPSRFRIADGETICVNSARAIAKLSIELPERATDSCLIPTGPLILASIVLAIYLLKHPCSRFRAMDLQLLKASLTYSSQQMTQSKLDSRFIQGLAVIYDQTQAHVDSFTVSEPARQSCQAQPSGAEKNSPSRPSSHAKPSAHYYRSAQLPTPSTYEVRTPTIRDNHDIYEHNAEENNRATPSDHLRPSSHDLISGMQAAAEHGWEPHTERQRSTERDMLTAQGANGYLCEPNTNIEGIDVLDEVLPFEGFNVGDLWNWMLVFDSPSSTDIFK